MRRFTIAAVAITTLGIITGCGVAQGEYDAVVAARDSARASVSTLETQLLAVTTERDAALASKGTLETQLLAATIERDTLASQLDTAQSDLSSSQADNAQLGEDLQQAQSNVTLLGASVDTLELSESSLQGQLADVQASLQELQSKFPLRPFSSRDELEAWLAADTVSEQPDVPYADDWYDKALELQQQAADDGYMISADFWAYDDGTYFVWNSAVLENGNYYWWDPEEDTLTFQLNVETWQ